MEYSGNEIETLVLKAARGGGIPTGHAEDLAAAAPFLDLDLMRQCPCKDGGAIMIVPRAIDLVAAGQGPQSVVAEKNVIEAYVAAAQLQFGQTLVWQETADGAVFEHFDPTPPELDAPLGRRAIPDVLLAHLKDMGAKLLVPETEASRAGGAGAGLTDND